MGSDAAGQDELNDILGQVDTAQAKSGSA